MPRPFTFGRSPEPVFVATFFLAGDGTERVEHAERLDAPDLVRLEGSILVAVDSVVLLSDEVVDAVFLVWSYLLEGLIGVGAGTAFAGSYPDLDYPVSIEEVAPRASTRHVQITVGRGNAYATAVAPWDEVYRALGSGAHTFLTRMEALAPRFAADYAEMRAQVAAVRALAGESDARLYGGRRVRRGA